MIEIPEEFLHTVTTKRNVSKAELKALRLALQGQTAEAIAETLSVSPPAVRKRLGAVYQKFEISGNTHGKLEILRNLLKQEYSLTQTAHQQAQQRDWSQLGEPAGVDDSHCFCGRQNEIDILKSYIQDKHYRLVAILGLGGIGKTALAYKVVQQLQEQFQYVIWRSLCNCPPVLDILADLIKSLSNQPTEELPDNLDNRIDRLIKSLQSSRCLLILDNFESVLQSGTIPEQYLRGYQGYGELLKRVGESIHQSCLILTSREKPKEIASLELSTNPVYSRTLEGLKRNECKVLFKAIFQEKNFSGTEDEWATENEWEKLCKHYAGNPLALKIAAAGIADLFSGNISEFLKSLDEGPAVFVDIRDLLDQQFNRLSHLEKKIMYWVAINRTVTLAELREDIIPRESQPRLLEALEYLRRRFLIASAKALLNSAEEGFTQPAVVMEYMIDKLVKAVGEEIRTQSFDLFICYALIKATVQDYRTTAQDYIQATQCRLILEPIADYLRGLIDNGSIESIRDWVAQVLSKLRQLKLSGYAAGNILNLLRALNEDLSGYNFSGLTIWQADLQNVILHDVNLSYSDIAKCAFTQTFGTIGSVAISPDGKIAAGDANGEIRLWRVADGQEILTFQGHTNRIRSIAFSPDGQKLASGSDDMSVKIWSVRTGECLKTFTGHSDWIWSVAFSPDGQKLASGSDDMSVKIWSVRTGECLLTLTGHTGWVWSVSFSSNNKILASGSEDKAIKIWDIETGECIKTIEEAHTQRVRSVAFPSTLDKSHISSVDPFDEKPVLLASSSDDKTVKIWDIETGKCLTTLEGHDNRVRSVTFSSDRKTLASSSDDKSIILWDVESGELLSKLEGHTNRVRSVAFSPDGKKLASGSDDQTVKIWDTSNARKHNKCVNTFQGYTNWIWSVAFSPDGKKLVSSSDDKTVRVWDIESGHCVCCLFGHTDRVRSVAFSPDGYTLASGGEDFTVRLWNAETGQCINVLRGHTNRVRSVAFSPDGKTLASGSEDKTVIVWDVVSGERKQPLFGHTERVWSVAFSPDGKTVASGSEDFTVRLWDAKKGRCIAIPLQGHSNRVRSVAFSPDGKTLVSGSEDKTLRLWDVETKKCLKTFCGHTERVWSVAFSPDGKTIASGSEDHTVRLWNITTGECVEILKRHTDRVRSVAFSPDGKTLASGSEDETIRLWQLNRVERPKKLIAKRPYDGMDITGVTGLTDTERATLIALGAKTYTDNVYDFEQE
jgi:WD40 repeat protein/DNA-binding CsgD family transcriptional regulator